jgi:hypothetical protein
VNSAGFVKAKLPANSSVLVSNISQRAKPGLRKEALFL